MWEQEIEDTVVLKILNAYPGAAAIRDARGWLPIRYAIELHRSDNCIQNMLRSFPDACKQVDLEGLLILHRALDANLSANLIDEMIEVNPVALRSKDQKKRSILHRALMSKCSPGAISNILTRMPDLAEYPSSQGSMPIHYALEYRARHDTIAALLECYPQGATIVFPESNIMPLQYAFSRGFPASTIKLLIDIDSAPSAVNVGKLRRCWVRDTKGVQPDVRTLTLQVCSLCSRASVFWVTTTKLVLGIAGRRICGIDHSQFRQASGPHVRVAISIIELRARPRGSEPLTRSHRDTVLHDEQF